VPLLGPKFHKIEALPGAPSYVWARKLDGSPSAGHTSPLESFRMNDSVGRAPVGSFTRSRRAGPAGSFRLGREPHGLPPGAFPPPCGRRQQTRNSLPRARDGPWRSRYGPTERGSVSSAPDDHGDADPGWLKRLAAGFQFWTSGRRPALRSPGSWPEPVVSNAPPRDAASKEGEKGARSRPWRSGGGRVFLLADGRRIPGCGRTSSPGEACPPPRPGRSGPRASPSASPRAPP